MALELRGPVIDVVVLVAVELDDSALLAIALELRKSVIDVVVPVAVELDVLESAVLVAYGEPSIEPRNDGDRRSEVVAVVDADIANVAIWDGVVAAYTEPAVISTR